MQFKELSLNECFRFHSFSDEVWRKVSETECICLSYEGGEVDEPYSLNQRVFPLVEKEAVRHVDRFQPITLITALRKHMQSVRENEKLEPVQKEYIVLGLAWAIVEIQQQAIAKDRFIPESTGYPGIDKATERYLMEHND